MKKFICAAVVFILLVTCFPLCAFADSAVSSVVINGDTGEVLYEKNAEEKLAMASTTKIMTALILCERCRDPEKTVKVDSAAANAEGTSMGLKAGEEVTVNDLLYGMLLSSGNDAAEAAAVAIGGSREKFIALMNEKAEELGLKNTSFETPSGLDGKAHYTTAKDLAALTRYALKNKRFATACAAKSVTLDRGDTIKNHNKLLFLYDDIIGVKTGYTQKAGRCLVSAARKDGMFIIAVTLNDKNDWQDHRDLIDLGYSALKEKENTIKPYKVNLPLANGGSINVTVPGHKFYSNHGANKAVKTFLPRFVYLPVEKGEILGYAEYYNDYKQIKRISIRAETSEKPQKYSGEKRYFLLLKMILRM